jgi:protein associated with RNAse G/E
MHPRAPWWGGFYERMMHLIKDGMAQCLEKSKCKTFPAFAEGILFIQRVINSTPMTWTLDNPKNPQPITPSTFLRANPPSIKNLFLCGIKPPEYHSGLKTKLGWTVRKIQKWQNQVWGIFHDMYISELWKRRKSYQIQTNLLLKKGQVILYKPQGVFHKLTPQGRLKWQLAHVKKLHPSPQDGRVRSVDIKLYDPKCKDLYMLTSQTIMSKSNQQRLRQILNQVQTLLQAAKFSNLYIGIRHKSLSNCRQRNFFLVMPPIYWG